MPTSIAILLIENQLECTDHVHLGQLLTSASGLEAVTIVWIAAEFTEEHRSTLDWLNKITDDSFRFFGLEVELWRIGSSPPAPKFNVISKPNNWLQSVAQAARVRRVFRSNRRSLGTFGSNCSAWYRYYSRHCCRA
jgi:hypothetical protein